MDVTEEFKNCGTAAVKKGFVHSYVLQLIQLKVADILINTLYLVR